MCAAYTPQIHICVMYTSRPDALSAVFVSHQLADAGQLAQAASAAGTIQMQM